MSSSDSESMQIDEEDCEDKFVIDDGNDDDKTETNSVNHQETQMAAPSNSKEEMTSPKNLNEQMSSSVPVSPETHNFLDGANSSAGESSQDQMGESRGIKRPFPTDDSCPSVPSDGEFLLFLGKMRHSTY